MMPKTTRIVSGRAERCEWCTFGAEANGFLACRKDPPQRIVCGSLCLGVWPVVQPGDYCGCFAAKSSIVN